MSYLVDTCVLAELCRPAPHPAVVGWFSQRPAATLYLSVLTLGELRRSIAAVVDPQRRMRMLDWLEVDLPRFFAGRMLPVDREVADRWGRMVAAAGRPLPAIEGLLGATATAHGLTLVTRHAQGFAGLAVDVLDPWGWSAPPG